MTFQSCRYNLRSGPAGVILGNDSASSEPQESPTAIRSVDCPRSNINDSVTSSSEAASPLLPPKSSVVTGAAKHCHRPSGAEGGNLPSDSRLLYQAPRKWTSNHLRIAKVKQENGVPLARIVDESYIPVDGDPEFERLASQFQDKVVENTDPSIHSGKIGDRKNPFFLYLNDLRRYKYRGTLGPYCNCAMLVGVILEEMYPDEYLTVKMFGRLPRSIAALEKGKGIPVDGSILRITRGDREDGADDKMGFPLGVVVQRYEQGELGMARYEIPQLLLQTNMVYNYRDDFELYEAFLISAEDYTYTIVRALASAEYLRSVRAGLPISGTFQVLRSRSLNLCNWEHRREFLRSIMALGRYSVRRPEFTFPMRKFRVVG